MRLPTPFYLCGGEPKRSYRHQSCKLSRRRRPSELRRDSLSILGWLDGVWVAISVASRPKHMN
jgi:hypothetical protein